MSTATSDADLFNLLKSELYTAVVGDVMDAMGLRRQFLAQAIQPLKNRHDDRRPRYAGA